MGGRRLGGTLPLDAEDLAKIAEMLKAERAETEKLIGTAVTVKLTEFGKTLDVEGKIKAVEAKIPAAPTVTDPPADPGKGKTKAEGDDLENSPAFKRLKAEMQEERKKAEEARKAAEDAEKARQEAERDAQVKDALTAAGADSKRLHIAMSFIKANSLVEVDDRGRPCFALNGKFGKELRPIADGGAKDFLLTEDGKTFVPATGNSGTGGKAGNAGTKNAGSEMSADSVLASFWGQVR